MKTIAATKFIAGKVVIGPKIVADGYYRIVSRRDRSGQIEKYDPQSRSWSLAPESVSFDQIWSAPPVSQLLLDLACASPSDGGEDADDGEAFNGFADDSSLATA